MMLLEAEMPGCWPYGKYEIKATLLDAAGNAAASAQVRGRPESHHQATRSF